MTNKWSNTNIEEINHSIDGLCQQWYVSDRDNENIFDKIIGLQIKKLRYMRSTKYRYVSQTKVAKAINVTFQQIQKYEKGFNSCSHKNLIKLCEYFEVDISYFTLPLIRNNLTFIQKRREQNVYKFNQPQFVERQTNTSHE